MKLRQAREELDHLQFLSGSQPSFAEEDWVPAPKIVQYAWRTLPWLYRRSERRQDFLLSPSSAARNLREFPSSNNHVLIATENQSVWRAWVESTVVENSPVYFRFDDDDEKILPSVNAFVVALALQEGCFLSSASSAEIHLDPIFRNDSELRLIVENVQLPAEWNRPSFWAACGNTIVITDSFCSTQRHKIVILKEGDRQQRWLEEFLKKYT